MYPSPILAHRRADQAVHALGLLSIVLAGGALLLTAWSNLPGTLLLACIVYVLCALASNQASCFYHFSPWHAQRTLLRRIDHSAIYLSITGTFTPLLIQAGTPRTYGVLALSWALAALAIYLKLTSPRVKSRWSTASYLGLGALGLTALPDLNEIPPETVTCILLGAGAYVIGTVFYSRKSLPFRYAIWHIWVLIGGGAMFAGIWMALF